MAEIIQLGQPPIEVVLKRSARARRLSLRVSGVDGRVSLSMPGHVGRADAIAFLQDKESWVRRHLDTQPDLISVQAGARIPVEGQPYQIAPTSTGQARFEEGRLLISGRPDRTAVKVKAFLKELARSRLIAASERYAAGLGRQFGRITLRDTRSRWGSCTSDGNLMYSWRLIMAPRDVLDYVAAHEVSHLAEMNHSPAFWSTVGHLMPNYAEPRAWLRQNGSSLHRYQF